MKKIWLLCLICLGLLVLTGCNQEDIHAGTYTCVAIEGVEEDEIPSDLWLRLDANGRGAIHVGLELDLTWELDDSVLTVETDFVENTYVGTMGEAMAVLEIDGEKYTFVRENAVEAWAANREMEATTEEPAPRYLDETYAGRYICTAIAQEETALEPKGEWLNLKRDGSATLHLDMEYPASWYLQEEMIYVTKNTGDVYSGTLKDGILSLAGDKSYTFRRAEPGEMDPDEGGKSIICVGSKWQGTLVEEYEDEDEEIVSTTYDVIAVIKEVDKAIYFEAYYAEDPERKPILSFRAALFANYLEPVIDEDEEDARVFDVTMDKEDIWDFTMFLGDENQLTAEFDYYYKGESKELYFTFYPDALAP